MNRFKNNQLKKPPWHLPGGAFCRQFANRDDDLAHTKQMCKYHIVFKFKYRGEVIDN